MVKREARPSSGSDTLMQQAYGALRDRMLSGELPPGTRLVNRTLGAQLGLSTVTIREALHRLTSEGLVEHVPNAGAFVRRLTRRELAQLYDLRLPLNEFAVTEAARKIDADQLHQLAAVCAAWRELIVTMRGLDDRTLRGKPLRRWIDLDAHFHRVLTEAADNPWLSKVVGDMGLISRVMNAKPPMLDFTRATDTYKFHRGLVRALRRGDAADAVRWIRIHDRHARAFALENFSDTHA